MIPVFDPQQFPSPFAPVASPARVFAGTSRWRAEGRPVPGRNKTMAYLKARHPHLAKMVDAGLPIDQAFQRAVVERRSRNWDSRPRPGVPTPGKNSPKRAGGHQMGAMEHIFQAARRGLNPGDPVGLDPQTILDEQQPGGAFYGPVGAIGRTLFVPMIAAGDAVLRGVNAAVHGGAAAAGQIAQELGQSQGMGHRLERDILMMPEALTGSVGRLPSAIQQGNMVPKMARQTVRHGTDVIHEKYHTGRIARQLRKSEPSTSGFGRINQDLLAEINKIRILEGEPPIGTRDVNVYANVLKKFQDKRIGLDGLTARQVAQTIYRVVHGKRTFAERGNFPTAQRLVNQQGKGTSVGYVGRGLKDDISVKSIMRVDQKELDRQRKR